MQESGANQPLASGAGSCLRAIRLFVGCLALSAAGWAWSEEPPTNLGDVESVMSGYAGLNEVSTKQARLRQIKQLQNLDHVAISIDKWPSAIQFTEPKFDDGDRGFVWVFTANQIRDVVIPRLAGKAWIAIAMDSLDEPQRDKVRLWAAGLGFASVHSVGKGE